MSRHVSEWLNAYHDGELRGNRLHQVEAHLAECELCQTELESLEGLSNLLHEVPAPKMISPERFAVQVNLRMPHTLTIISRRQVMEIGWWLIPVGILGAWVFISTSTALSGVLYEANRLGLLNSISGWIAFSPSSQISLAATLAQSGLLSGNSLNWAETTETFTRITLPQIGWQISIALLYLSWIAIWWVRHTRGQQHGRLLEG
jgi:predicted anti-sigma-YlaC factor YlaD